jgi:7-cyano-7-deazaguanine synthase
MKGLAVPDRIAVCLLSGGPDALVAAAMTSRAGFQLAAMFADYGQRTASRERRSAELCARWLACRHFREAEISWLAQIGGSVLTSGDGRVDGSNARAEYVPFRNTILLAHAVAWAEVIGAGRVVIGSTGSDRISPDNSPEYLAAFQRVVTIGTMAGAANEIAISAPLAGYRKADMVRLGGELGVPFADTWSCQNDGVDACGECNNCRARSAAFEELGLADPLEAADGPVHRPAGR